MISLHMSFLQKHRSLGSQGCSTHYTSGANVESQWQQLRGFSWPEQMEDSGAARSPNLCRAIQSPAGCHAPIRSATRHAQRGPRPTPGRGQALQTALRPVVLNPRRGHRRQFLSLDRNLHQGASPSAERRIRPALAACAGTQCHSLHPVGPWIRGQSSRCSVVVPRACAGSCSGRRRNRWGHHVVARRTFQNSANPPNIPVRSAR